MQTKDQILQSIQSIVDGYEIFAVIWHIVFYFLLAAILIKRPPSNKLLGFLLCLPLLSVAVFAWLSGNPFNGSVFLIASVLIFIFSFRASDRAIETSPLFFMLSGIFMVTFGLIYPHFIETDSVLEYFYASPAGIIPCPTLSTIIGFALIFNGFNSRSISLTLVITGLFYGLFGFFKLAVYLDIFLVLGAVVLLIKYILREGDSLQLHKA